MDVVDTLFFVCDHCQNATWSSLSRYNIFMTVSFYFEKQSGVLSSAKCFEISIINVCLTSGQ